MQTSKCDKCLEFYVTKELNDGKVCNTLVQFKEFKEGSMVRLNPMGDWLFKVIEGIFQLYRDKLKGEEITEPITKKILEKVETARSGQLPQCHLKMIIQRFLNGRIHWWTADETEKNKESEKEYLKNEAMSSKTQKSKDIGRTM